MTNTSSSPTKKKPGLFTILIIIAGSLLIGCCLCVGSAISLDALGLLDSNSSTQTPTKLSQITPTIITTPTNKPIPSLIPTKTAINPTTPALEIEGSACITKDSEKTVARVVEIIDGDTIVVNQNGVDYRVRYIGMDTPEMNEAYGYLAAEENARLVENKDVLLYKDKSETDRYNRLLRYVIVDDLFVNYELVKEGYAVSGSWPPDTACDKTFHEAEVEASNSQRGIWALDGFGSRSIPFDLEKQSGQVLITNIFYNGIKGDKEPDEYVEIKNVSSAPIQLENWTLQDKAKHVFIFPGYLLNPGEVCRIYTNESHPELCGFNYRFTKSAIWNNSGDCAILIDNLGNLVYQYCY